MRPNKSFVKRFSNFDFLQRFSNFEFFEKKNPLYNNNNNIKLNENAQLYYKCIYNGKGEI